MAVIIGAIAPRDTVFDDAMLELAGATDTLALRVGGSTYAYVAGFSDDGISVFEVGSDGSLANIQNIADDGDLVLDGIFGLTSAVVGGTTYLYTNSVIDMGISAFRVAADGTMTNIQNIPDDDMRALSNLQGQMSVAEVGDASFLIASSGNDRAVSVFRIQADGTLTSTDVEVDDDDPFGGVDLDNPMDTTTATVDGRTFVFVASFSAGGDVSVFELDAGGEFTFVQTARGTGAPDLNLSGAIAVTTATVGGTTYLIASGSQDDGLSVFSVSATGQLASVFNIDADQEPSLRSPGSLSTFSLGGETFVIVTPRFDVSSSLFHLEVDGTLTPVADLDFAGRSDFAAVDGIPLLIATGAIAPVSSFEIGAGDDTLTGTAAADVLLGLRGNDLLDGAAGSDHMVGGLGSDTYVVDSHGDEVVERAGEGTDTVRASISLALGSNLENLQLLSDAALDGTGNDLANEISGNDGANRLQGLLGRDSLHGGDGDDTLRGGKGRDHLFGGKGDDDLVGNRGKDILRGDGGQDDFIFLRVSDSGPNQHLRDRVEGFGSQDRLMLSAIDAVRGRSGNQAFVLDQDGSFSAGEVQVHDSRAGLLIKMNMDRDTRAEMSLLLKGTHGTLDDSDFLF